MSRASSSPRRVGLIPTDDAPAQRRATEEEDVLGHVVEQHADVPPEHAEVVELRGSGAALLHHLGPGPLSVIGQQPRARVRRSLDEELRDGVSHAGARGRARR